MPEVENVQNFLDSFLSAEQKPAPVEEQKPLSPIQQTLDNLNKPTNTETPQGGSAVEETKKPEENKSKEEIEAALNQAEEEKKNQEAANVGFVKDVTKLSELLKEKNLLVPFEDGSLPTTEEEFYSALEQSIPYQVEQRIQEAWNEKLENLSPSLLRIHEYADKGITTAAQLAEFTNAVAHTEMIGSLDPKEPEHQEQIVLLQLLNTGLDEKSAKDEVADLKARNVLADRASKFYPTLKKAYDDNVAKKELEQQREMEQIQHYEQANALNVRYFLEKDLTYLPFPIDGRDRNYKAQIFNLAGQPVDRAEDGTPIFGWQKHLEALQYGTEAEYKRFMKAMAFLADDKKYDEGVSKKVATATTEREFKKIATTSGKSINSLPTETHEAVGGLKKKSTQAWSA